MHTNDPQRLRSTGTSTGLRATAQPNPFPVPTGYVITVTGGIPPYTFTPGPTPPNPPGVTLTPTGNTCEVTVPLGTPPGMVISVDVTDSSQPPNLVKSTCQAG